MSLPRDLATIVLQWVARAENDYLNAEYVITMKDACPYDTVAFHAHQCAEKYIKCLMLCYGLQTPRTHDLVALVNVGKQVLPPEVKAELVQPLNRYAIESRYPGDWEPIEGDEARNALATTAIIRNAIRRELARFLPMPLS